MRTLNHPWDKVGHCVFFFFMAIFMSPLWAVFLCGILLEVDQYWTWHKKGWSWKDCFLDLFFNSLGIGLAIWLKLLF